MLLVPGTVNIFAFMMGIFYVIKGICRVGNFVRYDAQAHMF